MILEVSLVEVVVFFLRYACCVFDSDMGSSRIKCYLNKPAVIPQFAEFIF